MTANLAASVHARLLTRAKARDEDFNWILSRYAIERFLYRLSISPVRDRYWLKGALLFELWFATPPRPTHDADFLGFGPGRRREAGERSARDLWYRGRRCQGLRSELDPDRRDPRGGARARGEARRSAATAEMPHGPLPGRARPLREKSSSV